MYSCRRSGATARWTWATWSTAGFSTPSPTDYGLTLADPGAAAVARVLAVADQLVLVAPASPDAARALAMTQEWLGAHGYEALATNSITVVNGLSKRSMPHAEQAELVVRGRCRAIVRVPWDDHLAEPQAERGIRDSLDPAPPRPGSASCAHRSCRPTRRWPGCWSPRWPPARSGGGWPDERTHPGPQPG